MVRALNGVASSREKWEGEKKPSHKDRPDRAEEGEVITAVGAEVGVQRNVDDIGGDAEFNDRKDEGCGVQA